MIPVVNAYWSGDSIVVVSRSPSGKRQSKAYPAEYSCFLKASEVTPEIESKLRRWPRIKRWHPEGAWIRISWRSWADLKEATSPLKYPHPVHGGTESLFERMRLQVFEADVYPVRRWLTENDIEIQKPRRCYLDLETDSRVPFGRKEEARILSWAIVPDSGEWVGDVLAEDTDKAEHTMLEELWEALDQFDQVCAWNGDRFDFEVLMARTKLHGIEVNTNGWLWLDHLELFRDMNMHVSESGDEKQSFALGRIATQILGETKDDLDASKTWEYWEAGGEDREKLFKYNVRDADLLRLIEAETGYIDLQLTICQACFTLPDSRGNNGTNFVEGYLLKMGLKEGLRFRTNWDSHGAERFEGAYVMEPTRKGILHGVHVCDFSGMYPSIIQTWNISPETLRNDVVLTEDPMARPAYLKHVPLRTFPLPDDCCSVPGGAIFQTSPPGLVPRAIAEFKRLRKYWSDKKAQAVPGTPEWHDADRKSNAYKVCNNTFFGVMGATTSRFYAKDLGGSVAAAGRWLIQKTLEAAEKRGMSGVYGDSVTGDRTVVVRDPKRHVHMLPIAELWRRCSRVWQDRGKEFGELDWQALSMNLDGKSEWFPIRQVIRHRSGKSTFRISTKHGQTQVTKDHGIMVAGRKTTPEEFLAARSEFVKVDPHIPNPEDVVDLLEYVGGFSATFEYKGRSVVRRLVSDPSGQRIIVDGWGSEALQNSLSIQRFYHRGTSEYRALIRVVSAYVSDGSSSLRGDACRYLFSICKSNLELMNQVRADLQMISNVKIFGPYWTDTVYVVRSGTILMSAVFSELCGHGHLNKRLPAFMFDLDAESAGLAIRGFELGDGHIDAANQLSFCSTSQQLIAGVSYILAQHDRVHSFSFRPSKCAWSLRTRGQRERPSRYLIKSERLRPNDGWVYDLEVDEVHTFVDGVGRVLLHNTDSAFIMDVTESSFRSFVEWCNTDLYPGLLKELHCATNEISIAYEKEFKTLVLVGKKRYAATYEHYKGTRATAESKPEIKGLEYKRGDSVKLAREMQYEGVMRIMGGDEDPENFKAWADTWKTRILETQLGVRDFTLSKSLSRDVRGYARKLKKDGTYAAQPPHVEVAHVLAKRGFDAGGGARIEYIVVDGGVSPMKVIPAMDYTEGVEDRFFLWENLVWPPTERVLECAFPGVHWNSLLGKVRPVKARASRSSTGDRSPVSSSKRKQAPEEQGKLF